MIKQRTQWGAIALTLALVCGCNSSGGAEIPVAQAQAADCIALNLDDLEDIVIGLFQLAEALGENPIPATVSFDPGSGNYTIEVQLEEGVLPLNGTISGDDLTDGFTAGEVVDATWNRFGSGLFTLTYVSAVQVDIQGAGNISSLSACNTEILSVDVAVDPTDETNLVVNGAIEFRATVANGEILDGTITFDGSQVATVQGTFMGAAVSFHVDLTEFLAFP